MITLATWYKNVLLVTADLTFCPWELHVSARLMLLIEANLPSASGRSRMHHISLLVSKHSCYAVALEMHMHEFVGGGGEGVVSEGALFIWLLNYERYFYRIPYSTFNGWMPLPTIASFKLIPRCAVGLTSADCSGQVKLVVISHNSIVILSYFLWPEPPNIYHAHLARAVTRKTTQSPLSGIRNRSFIC